MWFIQRTTLVYVILLFCNNFKPSWFDPGQRGIGHWPRATKHVLPLSFRLFMIMFSFCLDAHFHVSWGQEKEKTPFSQLSIACSFGFRDQLPWLTVRSWALGSCTANWCAHREMGGVLICVNPLVQNIRETFLKWRKEWLQFTLGSLHSLDYFQIRKYPPLVNNIFSWHKTFYLLAFKYLICKRLDIIFIYIIGLS